MAIDLALVNEIRVHVLESTGQTTLVPEAGEVGLGLGRPTSDVIEAFRLLAANHVYVLEPGNPARLRMANPYSAVPSPFRVEAAGRTYFGNCIWDGLGIVSLLGGTGRVLTGCPDCQEPLELVVDGHRLLPAEGVVHFAVPARQWWDDIIHT